jgi:hypothetical protein
MLDGFKREFANLLRQGFAAAAEEDGATMGQVPKVAADGQMEFGDAGGGSLPPARNVGQCSFVFVNAPPANPLSVAFDDGDATFIDATTPTSLKPVTAGIYSYAVIASRDGGGAGQLFIALLRVDDDWYSVNARQGDAGEGFAVAAVTWYSDALSPFWVGIIGNPGDTFTGRLYVQKIA